MLLYPHIDPVAIALGPLKFRWYGIMYLLGFIAAWFLGRWRSARPDNPFSKPMIDDLIAWCIIGLVLGGRLGYALFYQTGYFLEHPLAILKVWQGGMSFHGGMLGVFLAMYLYSRRNGLRFFEVTDFIAPLVPPGLFAGRIGNFINAELWGRPTDLPWGMVFPDQAAGFIPRHPSQLYEAGLEGVLLFVLLWLFTSKPRPTMAASGLFLILYGCFRFLVEFVRQPDPQLGYLAFDWLTMGQVLSMPMALLGVFLLAVAYRKHKA